MRWDDHGSALLEGFRQRDPEEAGRYVLSEARFLRDPGFDVEKSSLYQIAQSFGALPPGLQRPLLASAVKGFVSMPVGVRKEAAEISCELIRNALECVREGGAAAEPSGSPRDSMPPMLANFVKVIDAAGFYKLEVQEQEALMQQASQAAASAGPPGGPPMRELLEFACQVCSGLGAKERRQLSKTAAAPKVLGEGQLWIIERVLQPNGYAEMITKLLDTEQSVRRLWWVFLLVQLVQVIICYFLKPCREVPMRDWLGVDAALWLTSFFSGCLAYRWGCPAVREILQIMAGTPGAAPRDGDMLGSLWPVIFMAITCCLCLLIGSLAAFAANVYLVMAVFEDCNTYTVGVCGFFILLRHVATSVVAFHIAWVVQEICFVMRKLVNPSLSDAPKKSYGSTASAEGLLAEAA